MSGIYEVKHCEYGYSGSGYFYNNYKKARRYFDDVVKTVFNRDVNVIKNDKDKNLIVYEMDSDVYIISLVSHEVSKDDWLDRK